MKTMTRTMLWSQCEPCSLTHILYCDSMPRRLWKKNVTSLFRSRSMRVYLPRDDMVLPFFHFGPEGKNWGKHKLPGCLTSSNCFSVLTQDCNQNSRRLYKAIPIDWPGFQEVKRNYSGFGFVSCIDSPPMTTSSGDGLFFFLFRKQLSSVYLSLYSVDRRYESMSW